MTLPLLLQRVREAGGPFGREDARRLVNLSPWLDGYESDCLFAALMGSLDAAVALCERVRPSVLNCLFWGNGKRPWAKVGPEWPGSPPSEDGATPALALLAALLASLTQEAHEDDR